jgi:serine protease Do
VAMRLQKPGSPATLKISGSVTGVRKVRRSSRWASAALLLLALATRAVRAQEEEYPALNRGLLRGGEETLRAFASVSRATRNSIVKFNLDGKTVALGTVVDPAGLALTKASEIGKGKLTCWLASDKEVSAEVLAADDAEDLALVRVNARGLKAIQWSTDEVWVGQWAITPGIAETPHAAGIISTLPHRVRPERAYIGVQFDLDTTTPKIGQVMPGLGAEKAGLKAGDVILTVNGAAVTNRQEVVDSVRELRQGQVVKVRVKRAETEFDSEIRLMPLVDENSDRPSSRLQRFERLRGEVSQRSQGFERAIEHDTVLQPWLCGGPLVNLDGKALGINIARAGRVSTYAVPTVIVQRILKKLRDQSGSVPPF